MCIRDRVAGGDGALDELRPAVRSRVEVVGGLGHPRQAVEVHVHGELAGGDRPTWPPVPLCFHQEIPPMTECILDQPISSCLLYTSDAADDLTRVDLGGRRVIN